MTEWSCLPGPLIANGNGNTIRNEAHMRHSIANYLHTRHNGASVYSASVAMRGVRAAHFEEVAMGIADDAVEIRARGWRILAALHNLIETTLEQALRRHELSVVEFTVLDALSRQDGWHMRMQQLAREAALSGSAASRLVNRLEDRDLLTRVLCKDDRRGIYTELTERGRALLHEARPTHDQALESALAEARRTPELAPLAEALHHSPSGGQG